MSALNRRLATATALVTLSITGAAHAEIQLQGYVGANGAFSSDLKLDKGGVQDKRNIDWEGKPFEAPPYWGARATYWLQPQTCQRGSRKEGQHP